MTYPDTDPEARYRQMRDLCEELGYQPVPKDSKPAWERDEGIRQESLRWQQVRDQACLYMAAVYGPNWFFIAPETFDNLLVRWIVAVANSDMDFAGEQMTKIEELATELERNKGER